MDLTAAFDHVERSWLFETIRSRFKGEFDMTTIKLMEHLYESTTTSLAETPEWYHTLGKTCTTAIVDQVNLITPGRIPRMWRTLLPGHSARAAWKLKLIEDWGGFESTVEASRIDERARKWDGKEEYSRYIRAHLPPK